MTLTTDLGRNMTNQPSVVALRWVRLVPGWVTVCWRVATHEVSGRLSLLSNPWDCRMSSLPTVGLSINNKWMTWSNGRLNRAVNASSGCVVVKTPSALSWLFYETSSVISHIAIRFSNFVEFVIRN